MLWVLLQIMQMQELMSLSLYEIFESNVFLGMNVLYNYENLDPEN